MILIFKYLKQEDNTIVSPEILDELKKEIKFFATLEEPNQFKLGNPPNFNRNRE